MAPTRGSSQRRTTTASLSAVPKSTQSISKLILPVLITIFGPLSLIYLTLRCEKNQCVLFQLPLIVPQHVEAYFSVLAFATVLIFISSMFIISFGLRPLKPGRNKASETKLTTGVDALVTSSVLLTGIFYLKPAYVDTLFSHYLRFLVIMTVFCVAFVCGLMIANALGFLPKRHFEYTGMSAFFWGTHTQLYVGPVELKSFFYIHVGLIAWALLDLLILLNHVHRHSLTGPLGFLTFSQFLVVAHSLVYERFLLRKPFKETEGLGFFWMMRVLLFLPFFHSLPVLHASVTEITLPKPAMLCDVVLFCFGFIVYLSAIHQKENFNADPSSYKNLQSIAVSPGKRLLTSGYWSVVQKPDYMGYMIMWLSWAIACGFSGVSVLVLLTMYLTIFAWQYQLNIYNSKKLGSSWQRYTSTVNHKIIPLVL